MPLDVLAPDRLPMSPKERDALKVRHGGLRGQRSRAEAARLLELSTRHGRRQPRQLEAHADAALVHGLRGRPANHQAEAARRHAALQAYRQRYADFGPTFASVKRAAEELRVCPLAAGLWQPKRRRQQHRSRRPRRACFGALVQLDASIPDWLEGRAAAVVLLSMLDDATCRTLTRCDPAATTAAHLGGPAAAHP